MPALMLKLIVRVMSPLSMTCSALMTPGLVNDGTMRSGESIAGPCVPSKMLLALPFPE